MEKGYLILKNMGDIRVQYGSTGAYRLLGRGENEIIGQEPPLLPEGVVRTVEPLDGEHELWILTVRGDEGGALAELEAANRHLADALHSAESASEAKNSFLSNMSHDIRTPMNAIVGMTSIALNHIDEQGRVLDSLNKIQTASSHLMSLINDVLDMSHIESGKMSIHYEPFSLPDLLHDLVVIVRPQAAQKKQSLRFETRDIKCEELVGDALRVRQIMVNIVGNAVKYTPEGGNIQVSLREEPGLTGTETVLRFVCADDGIGMSQEFLTRIFQPFERAGNTTQSKIEGTGLGMAIVHRLVTQMGGDIKVESQLGKGSRFEVSIPFQAVRSSEERGDLKGAHILVVERNQEQADLIEGFLQDAGLTCTLARESMEAVTWLTEAVYEDRPPCAVLLGEDPGGVSALDMAGYLRQITGQQTPILLVSEADWPQIEHRAVRMGINAFVPCPLFRSRLLAAIRRLAHQNTETPGDAPDRVDYTGKRFLLVEDNPLNQEIAMELLSASGAEIDTANDGEDALQTFSNSPAQYYDLILMDIQMPVMDGYEATRRIRALDRPDAGTVCIVAMTANVFMEDVQRARDAGMNDHLPKPVDMEKVDEILRKYLM